ncbi:MAG: hypothetical protein WDA16_07955, partial [Candidatus Thermoplasmatota archaeon]
MDGVDIELGRVAGVLFEENSTGNVSASDIKYNFGTGLVVTSGSVVEAYATYFRRDGYGQDEPALVYVGPLMGRVGFNRDPTIGTGGVLSINQSAFEGYWNGVVVHREWDSVTNFSISQSSFNTVADHGDPAVYSRSLYDETWGDPRYDQANNCTANRLWWWGESQQTFGEQPSGQTAAHTGFWSQGGLPMPEGLPGAPPRATFGGVTRDVTKMVNPGYALDARLTWWVSPMGPDSELPALDGAGVVG